jgi:hypothetical protein
MDNDPSDFTDVVEVDDDPLSPGNLVENALRPLKWELRSHIASAMAECSEKLEDLQERVARGVALASIRSASREVWGKLLDSIGDEVRQREDRRHDQ